VLVVAPFTHQNGHFVTFPRDVCCGLAAAGHQVTLVHARPFASDLDWHGNEIRKICLKERVDGSPWWWRELWARLAGKPSSQCLAWLIWKLRPRDFDLVLWTDFQAQSNVWALTLARACGLYRFRTALCEHHPPEHDPRWTGRALSLFELARYRLGGVPMVVFSEDHLQAWRERLGATAKIEYVPYGLWPTPLDDRARVQARQELELPSEARVLLVFGVQAIRRKHLDTLLAAVDGLAPNSRLLLLFVGRNVNRSAHPFAGRNLPVGIRFDDRFVPEAEAARYFAAADAVWAAYRDFPGASGVLLQAIGHGRLSITSDSGEIGRLSSRHDIGLMVASPTPERLHEALQRFIALDPERQRDMERRCQHLASSFSWDAVMPQLLAAVLRLGGAPAVARAARSS
jgi:glycosyltransferase involved in cell wall biosynthesis